MIEALVEIPAAHREYPTSVEDALWSVQKRFIKSFLITSCIMFLSGFQYSPYGSHNIGGIS